MKGYGYNYEYGGEAVSTPTSVEQLLNNVTFWGRADEVTDGVDTGDVASLLNRSGGSASALTNATQSQQPPRVTGGNSTQALAFRGNSNHHLLGDNDTSYYGGSTGGTSYHVFCVFEQEIAPTLSATNIWQNHLVMGSSWIGAYSRDVSGQANLAWYHWSTSQFYVDMDITVGSTHLLEAWHDGSTVYARLDNGSTVSTAVGESNGESNLRIGPSPSFQSEILIHEIVTCSSDNSSNTNLSTVRSYFSGRYGMSV